MILDLRTMYFAVAATCLIVAAALLSLHSTRVHKDGLPQWAFGWACYGAFWLLLGLRGAVGDFFSIVLANTFVTASYSLLHAAVRKFSKRCNSTSAFLLPVAATFAFVWYFSAFVDRLSYRVVFVSFLSVLQISGIILALLDKVPVTMRRSHWLTAFGFFLMGICGLNRLVEGLVLPYGQLSVLQVTTFRSVSVLAALGTVVLSSMGFVLMIRERAEETLRWGEERLRSLFETCSDSILLKNRETGEFLTVNSAACRLYGYSPEEFVNLKDTDISAEPDETERVRHSVGPIPFRLHRKKDGTVFPVEITTGSFIQNDTGFHTAFVRDITRRKQAEESLRWRKTFLEALVNSSQDGILILDNRMQKVLQNDRLVEMWKMPQDIAETEDDEQRVKFLMASIKDPREFYAKLTRLYDHSDEIIKCNFELKDGPVIDALSYPVRGDAGEHYGRIWMFRDITEVQHYWDMLENLSTTDGLTEISNRRRFDAVLGQEWRKGMREQTELSLIIMDIDFFKEFNDRYGHLAGDDCLKRVAATLKKTVQKAEGTAARYGGEEFACILPKTGRKKAGEAAQQITDEIAALRIRHEASPVAGHLTLSFGVATMVPQRGCEPSDLIMMADQSLYSAKQQGRNRVVTLPGDCEAGKNDSRQNCANASQ